MLGVNVIAADHDAEADRLFTTLQQIFLNLIRGHPKEMSPPVNAMTELWNPLEEAHVNRMTRISAVGGPETIRKRLSSVLEQTGANEIIATAHIFDHQARLRSFELAAEIFHQLKTTG